MRYLFVHAHPDDETLSTGAIIAGLVAQGDDGLVLTATRGEMGQAVAGSLPPGVELATVRTAERARALVALGAIDAGWLGDPPNRADRRRAIPRIYRDSGMEWIEPGIAGPSPQAAPDSLCRADLDEVVADLVAATQYHRPDALVSYDRTGGYGHPDHVRCHEATSRTALELGLPFFEIVTDPHLATNWYDLSHQPTAVLEAHQSYSTQFVVDGDQVIHVGGQSEQIRYAAGLRLSS